MSSNQKSQSALEGRQTPVPQGRFPEPFVSLKMGENFPLEFLRLHVPFVWFASEARGLNPVSDSYALHRHCTDPIQ